MRPSIWEEDDSGKGSGPDILAEERERRLRQDVGVSGRSFPRAG